MENVSNGEGIDNYWNHEPEFFWYKKKSEKVRIFFTQRSGRRPPPFGRGGLGVFAFQDVPVRRFAPSSLYLRFILLFHLTSGVTGSAALKHGFLSHRLLRMNVQGCHYILAICLHIEFETMTASGPVHHPSNTIFFLHIFSTQPSTRKNQHSLRLTTSGSA